MGLDSFGYDYALRALIAGAYLGGNGEKEAVYPARYADAEGHALTATQCYRLSFTKAPPVGAFWSLTMYDATDKMLVDNPINRYKVGLDTQGMKIDSGGSSTIAIQHDEPQGADKENWLPAPKGGFYLMLRMYPPNGDILDGAYALPQLVNLK
jgi:hypothetical protein